MVQINMLRDFISILIAPESGDIHQTTGVIKG
jgi:hypothetical protein